DLHLAEDLQHAEVAVDRRGRSALTREIAGLELLIRIQRQRFLAILGTDVDPDSFVRPWRLHAHFTESAGNVSIGDLLRGLAVDHTEHIEIIHGGSRYRPGAKRIVGHAVRIASVERRAADDVRARRTDRNNLARGV